MQLGIVGLGRMGANIVRRLMRAGHACVVHDRDPAPGRELAGEGATAAASLAELVAALDAPRAVWVMLPAGDATEGAIESSAGLLVARRYGDRRRQHLLEGRRAPRRRARRTRPRLSRRRHVRRGVGARARLLPDDRRRQGGRASGSTRSSPRSRPASGDIPATGGRDGRDRPRRAGLPACRPERRRPLRQDDPQRHRVRHDAGDRRGLRHPEERRLAEARRRSMRFAFDLADVAEVWRRGSVITSWLLDLTAAALAEDGELCGLSPAMSRIPAKAAGPCRRRSRRRCRPRC